MKQVDRYQCEICKQIYETELEAIECESQGKPVVDESIGDTVLVNTESGGFGNHWVYTAHEALIIDILPGLNHEPLLLLTHEYYSEGNIDLQSLPNSLHSNPYNCIARIAMKSDGEWHSKAEMTLQYTREEYHNRLIPAMKAAGMDTESIEKKLSVTQERMIEMHKEVQELEALK